ncbi:FHA domain-containing protein [Marinicella rhabdoformis]|uniref:FHA domain-containing protein n=1 Tax=Marinicella rhabdoformis TaxID=2580566 RepID=UPI0012AEC535|nr:FHA domain-containing protein [Marinicella rhabdoformis]
MKLNFPHGELKDKDLVDGDYRIGSSDEAEVVIKDKGLAEVHATLHVKGKELSISIDNEARLVSVNGKLVKQNKEVRPNDLIIMAQVHLKVIDVTEEEEDDNRTRIRMALPKFVLRGVSGAYFGKTFPLRGATVLGRHSECHVCINADGISRKHAQITVEADGLSVKDLGSSNGTYVNGEKIDEAHLNVGDEVKLDNLRFLIQTPGMPEPAGKEASQKNTAPHGNAAPLEQSESSGSGALKWVITIGVLGGAVFAAWKMGYLNGLLG